MTQSGKSLWLADDCFCAAWPELDPTQREPHAVTVGAWGKNASHCGKSAKPKSLSCICLWRPERELFVFNVLFFSTVGNHVAMATAMAMAASRVWQFWIFVSFKIKLFFIVKLNRNLSSSKIQKNNFISMFLKLLVSGADFGHFKL